MAELDAAVELELALDDFELPVAVVVEVLEVEDEELSPVPCFWALSKPFCPKVVPVTEDFRKQLPPEFPSPQVAAIQGAPFSYCLFGT